MEKRVYALFGVIGPLLVYLSIAASLALSPWFNWENNALSDLGHPLNSNVASIFNLGLLLAGFFLMIYAATVFREHAKYSGICLLISTFLIQLLATFNELYGSLHYTVAVPHFIMLSITSIVYTIEKRSMTALTIFLLVLGVWTLYTLHIFNIGIAVPEAISKIDVAWIMVSAIKIYVNKQTN